MTFSFHPEAEEDLRSAIDHYECLEAGLGHEFSLEVLTAIYSIVTHPNAWPVIEDDVRRCLVNRLPFGVLYSLEPTSIFVPAVMHHRRRPGYWKNRE